MRPRSRVLMYLSVGVSVAVVLCVAAGAYFWWGGGWAGAGAARDLMTPVSRDRRSSVIYLAAPTPLPETLPSRPVPSLLMRELQRQSILMAAREGLGMYTRDAVLREPPPEGAARANASLRLDPTYLEGSRMPITLQEDGPGGATLLVRDVPFETHEGDVDLLKVVEDSETKSRGQYLDLLRKCGFAGDRLHAPQDDPTTRPALSDGGLETAERELAELNAVSQFAAVRRAHTAIRASGESQPWLGVLVRGYANLGQLTWKQWNAFHQVFAARSLLYAQRMVVNDPHSPAARWHRAYALALVGLHRNALDDLSQARAPDAKAMPYWAKVVEPLCHYRTAELADMASSDKGVAPLAMFACFLTVEHCGSESAVIETAKAALEVNPRCMRLVDALCEHSGVSYLHILTEAGPAAERAALAGELHALEPFPQGVIDSVDALKSDWREPGVVAAAASALVDAVQPAEPSWSALGREIQAINFVHVQRRAEFMAQKWGVDASEFVKQSMPLVKDDPFLPVIEAYACFSNGQVNTARLTALTQNLEVTDPRPPMKPAWELRPIMPTPAGKILGGAAMYRSGQESDPTAYDEEESIPLWHLSGVAATEFDVDKARRLQWVSPFSPTTAAMLILTDWDQARQHAKEWSSQFPGQPLVNFAFATKYSELKEFDKAEPYWRAYLRVAPDAWAYRKLAENYLAAGHEDKWLQTMKEQLKQPDYALDHASIETDIAEHYMEKGDYRTAQPYADAAAESYAYFALDCDARCHEGLKNWDHAVALWQACAARYNQPLPWYMLVRRSGHGNLAAAQLAAIESVGAPAEITDWKAFAPLIKFWLVSGDRVRAGMYLRQEFDLYLSPWAGLNLMVLDLKARDVAAARADLEKSALHGDEFIAPITSETQHEYVPVARLLLASMAGGSNGALDLRAVEKAIAPAAPAIQADLWYIVGEFLLWQGHTEDATTCLRRAADAPFDRPDVILALDELRQNGVLPPAM